MNKRFVSIWFPHLLTDWHSRKQPALRNKPFVLKAAVHNRFVVTAASPLAQAQGVQAGMVLADAKALFPDLTDLDDKPGLAAQLLQRIAEWCIRFTPVAAPDSGQGVLLEATGCTHLWGGEAAYLADISGRLQQRGYTVRAAMADTPGCAWAIARYVGEPLLVEQGRQRQAAEHLPVAALRLDTELVHRLQQLGLHRIKDLLGMPPAALRRRWGPAVGNQMAKLLGTVEEPIKAVYPPEPYTERLPALEPIVTRKGIELALQHLLEALCCRLRHEGKGLREAVFRCYKTDGSTQGIEVATSKPTQNELHLFHLFSLKLGTLAPGGGIELFLLEAKKLEAHEAPQESLWGGTTGLNSGQLAGLLDRIASKMGAEAISRFVPAAHWWPERSFRKAASLEETPLEAWRTDKPRPIFLLAPPEQIEVTAPIPDYPPMNFRYKGVLHQVVKADGPERIEQEWWIQEGEHRDYYAVEDEGGCRYWLFRSGHYSEERKPRWFLHGLFA